MGWWWLWEGRRVEQRRSGFAENAVGAIFSSIFGIVIFIGAIALENWNESRAEGAARSLSDGAKSVVNVSSDALDPANEGKLVYLTGTAEATEPITDHDFKLKADALVLSRTVEKFQWTERKMTHKERYAGGSTQTDITYDYFGSWSESIINSRNFRDPTGHQNNSTFHFPPFLRTAELVKIGAYQLHPDLLKKLKLEAYPLDRDRQQYSPLNGFQFYENCIYVGRDPFFPNIGDEKVTYKYFPADITCTVIGTQKGEMIVPYQAENKDIVCMMDRGTIPASKLFKEAATTNNGTTWMFRGVGLLALWAAFLMMSELIVAILSIIPVLGDAAYMGAGVLAFMSACSITAVVIGIHSIGTRNVMSLALLALVLMAIILAIGSVNKKNAHKKTRH